ncbi:uncharacterized protein K02A2.6-like, partial [Temnothorax curvispinosus]|uniref:RNA-directed DNA polymerase n=1 Tax=Temnothorax curvispinosus TaxID=300111 RepID=A0A6J1QSG3_9HYME
MQIVEKPDGSLRICLDPKPLNMCIKREHFLIPTAEDIVSQLSGKHIFTVLDLSNGFWQMELDRKSSDLTTFMTPFGRFRWNRVPFGLNSAPEMFQKKMIQIFGDIPGVKIYFDDIAISGSDLVEHDRTLAIVLQRARANNIRFNPNKIQYRRSNVKFMGYHITNGYISPDIKYLDAILKMSRPSDKPEVMRLLGLFKYLSRFIPNLSQRSAKLRELTKNGSQWLWTADHEKELADLKRSITTKPALRIYDPNEPVVIQTDSSKDGLGSVLLQNGQPVAYASRSLTASEQKWAQIEKETLAIVFACERFHHFLYGREFTVQSDHKPLESLIKQDIDDVTARLQRMFLHLLKYPGLTIVYTPGKDMHVADCLSRATVDAAGPDTLGLSGIIHSVTRQVCLSEENYNLYKNTLKGNERYSRVVKYVVDGWPSYHKLDEFSQTFYRYKDQLHFENSLLFKDHRLVIPTELQSKICKWVHAPHLGIEKTVARAREQFFWPGMTNDIKEAVKDCVVCEQFTRNNQKEPLKQDVHPEYPFHRIAIDLYEYAGLDFIALIDAYSGFVCSERIKSKTCRHIIDSLHGIFCRYGYPTEIRCDNSPFNSLEFDKFANDTNIIIKYSSPRYPQSNGLAEKGVAIAKNILKRCYEANEVELFAYRLLEYNVTPVANMRLSPAQLFFGRRIKTKLPTSRETLLRDPLDEAI